MAVDNPAAGEASDLERYTLGSNYDYDVVSRYLLELGWSYLGICFIFGYAGFKLDEDPEAYS